VSRCEKLLVAAQRNSEGLRFVELCALAECHGWKLIRQRGSHQTYKRPFHPRRLTIQPGSNGMALVYQVKQVLDAIATLTEEESQ